MLLNTLVPSGRSMLALWLTCLLATACDQDLPSRAAGAEKEESKADAPADTTDKESDPDEQASDDTTATSDLEPDDDDSADDQVIDEPKIDYKNSILGEWLQTHKKTHRDTDYKETPKDTWTFSADGTGIRIYTEPLTRVRAFSFEFIDSDEFNFRKENYVTMMIYKITAFEEKKSMEIEGYATSRPTELEGRRFQWVEPD